ncbi:hypothetical protein [Halalkalicoccus tibetensis]|uniref:Uncharacterized protein n=1 Tax=Halalkalicoccus tibetensis TaxID=175632 RepID=A0ABD5V190_9EURY
MSGVERNDEGVVNRAVDWVLFDGSRWAVAGGSLLPIVVLLGLMAGTDLLVLDDTEPLLFLFSAIVGGNFTLLTVVLSVNQLVLSRQLESPGEVRDRIGSVHDYRDEVESHTEGVAPVLPPEFFLRVLEGARRQAQELGGLVAGRSPDPLREDVDELVETVTAQIDRSRELYGQSEAGTVEVLVVALETNYAMQIRDARRIKRHHEAELSEELRERIDDLIDSLEHVDVARQYLKTLYIQDELARFSRLLLYVGIPAMFVPICVLAGFTTAPGIGSTNPFLPALVVASIVVGLLPLAVLFAFVLRVASVSQETIAITPFTMAQQESEDRSNGSEDGHPGS